MEPETGDDAEKLTQEMQVDDEAEPLSNEERLKPWQNPAGNAISGEGWGRMFLLLILGAVAYWGYGWLNEQGWIEHDHDTPVWIKGEWLAGEYRVCQIPLVLGQSLPDSAHLLCGQSQVMMEEDMWSPDFIGGLSDHEFVELMAGQWSPLDQHFHVLPVHYWGMIDRRGRKMFSWRCQRNSDSLTCKALN